MVIKMCRKMFKFTINYSSSQNQLKESRNLWMSIYTYENPLHLSCSIKFDNPVHIGWLRVVGICNNIIESETPPHRFQDEFQANLPPRGYLVGRQLCHILDRERLFLSFFFHFSILPLHIPPEYISLSTSGRSVRNGRSEKLLRLYTSFFFSPFFTFFLPSSSFFLFS